MQQQYNIHQLRYLSNTVLYALSTRALTDTRPSNPEHRNRITSSPVRNPGSPNTSIPETRRMLAISPAHNGLRLPTTGILIQQSQLDAWRNQASDRQRASLDRAIQLTRKAKNTWQSPPLLWHPHENPVNGWTCLPNTKMSHRARGACLHLLVMALNAGNVKPIGADEKSIGRGLSSTALTG